MLYSILISVQILLAVGLIALILLQQGKGADAGAAFGSGASQTVFGARGSASFLTRATALFAFLFLANSFTLAFITSRTVERPSLLERVSEPAGAPANGPVAPENAESGSGGGVPQDLIDSLNAAAPEGVDFEVVPPEGAASSAGEADGRSPEPGPTDTP
mgnify:CR=1 FL=1